jgi:hypothetical protein
MRTRLLAVLSITLFAVIATPGAASAADLPSFRIPGQFPSGIVPGDNRIADFTEDGRNDVAVTDPARDSNPCVHFERVIPGFLKLPA